MTVPVIMTHGGSGNNPDYKDQRYLEFTLKQAQQYNERVILLGDETHKHLKVEHYNYAEFYKEAEQFFEKEYVQYSYYKEGYDRFVMAIFFMLKAFMQSAGLKVVANIDSDVMLYCNMTEEEKKLPPDYLLGCCIPDYQPPFRWNASTEKSFWTLEGVCEMCDFMHRMYTTPEGLAKIKSKWDWHIENKKPGGVCDLTLLWLFVESRNRNRIVNLTPVIQSAENGTFSHKISGSENSIQDEYRMSGRLKEIQWRNGKPYGFNVRLGEWIRFKDVHLQGGDKHLAPSFYRNAE